MYTPEACGSDLKPEFSDLDGWLNTFGNILYAIHQIIQLGLETEGQQKLPFESPAASLAKTLQHHLQHTITSAVKHLVYFIIHLFKLLQGFFVRAEEGMNSPVFLPLQKHSMFLGVWWLHKSPSSYASVMTNVASLQETKWWWKIKVGAHAGNDRSFCHLASRQNMNYGR